MAVWGIAATIRAGEVLVVGIEVHGPRSNPTATEVFRHRMTITDDWAQALRTLSSNLDTTIHRLNPTAVVIRALDHSPSARGEAFVRLRHQIDGVLLVTAREHSNIVQTKSGREIGEICGGKKSEAETEAVDRFGPRYKDSGAAGIAALVLAGEA
jgi:hypothetical protein